MIKPRRMRCVEHVARMGEVIVGRAKGEETARKTKT
jgi:hypothetical protein